MISTECISFLQHRKQKIVSWGPSAYEKMTFFFGIYNKFDVVCVGVYMCIYMDVCCKLVMQNLLQKQEEGGINFS